VIDLLDHWQPLIAGLLAFVAGFGTVVATIIIANKQITASREEADRVIAATREQTETTVQLERERELSEAQAFRAMLAAAMTRVLDEAACARRAYPGVLATPDGVTVDALTCSPVHHQRRVRGIARRVDSAWRRFDRFVS
jgi:hypothetical protein